MGWCDSDWLCGTVYDRDTFEARPPPPCPLPPPGHHPPVLPGKCRFNASAGKCDFFPNKTSKQQAQHEYACIPVKKHKLECYGLY